MPCFKKGQLDDANRAVPAGPSELNPDYAEARYNLGMALGLRGQLDEAVEQYREATKIKPDYVEAYNNLGNILFRKGQLDEAITQYRKAIEIKPDYAEFHYNLGVALGLVGKLEEAVREYQRTLELAPNSDQAHFRYGQALQAQHRFAAAKVSISSGGRPQSPNGPAGVYLSLAWLLATCPDNLLRNGEKAVELAQQAGGAGRKRYLLQLLDALAAAYAEAGRFDKAVETAKRALTSLPFETTNLWLTSSNPGSNCMKPIPHFMKNLSFHLDSTFKMAWKIIRQGGLTRKLSAIEAKY